ncbi:MAG: shikimate kinase [Bacteroidota bacterium]|jgi:shikimate kinase
MPNKFAKNIYLIGMPGAGKSSVGKKLAKVLDYTFIDLDARIEGQEKLTLSEIFASKGEAYFREAEHQCLLQTEHEQSALIATGGGTPCYFNQLEWMNEHGLTIYLEAAPQLLTDRIVSGESKRPLFDGKNPEEILPFIMQLLEARKNCYEQAKLKIKIPVNDFQTIATQALQLLNQEA